MEFNQLTAISPIDGRYYTKTNSLRVLFSEFGLQNARVEIEIKWLIHLAQETGINEFSSFDTKQLQELHAIHKYFTIEDAKRIKSLESTINHDVKAVEYFIAEKLQLSSGYEKYLSFIHFACTSEDINNLAYAISLEKCRKEVLFPCLNKIHDRLVTLATEYKNAVMLSRTHGQAATPTTMGKELINFAARLKKQLQILKAVKITGKFNGAVGNYNAHSIAYPEIDWPKVCQSFVQQLGLEFNDYTTQINPHDDIAEYAQSLIRLNNILLDLVKDVWGYISLGYFKQKLSINEVGSSTMPHKVNPIDFENAEGNLGMANSLLNFFANKLTQSRWQRDLSDSTVLRNMGCAFAYSTISYQSIIAGLEKLNLNTELLKTELNNHWELLAEPIQTIMRRYGITDAYEQLKALSRGTQINQPLLHEFINSQNLPPEVKAALKKLHPSDYSGYAARLVEDY